MTKSRKSAAKPQPTFADRIAAIEAAKAACKAECEAFIAASLAFDARVCKLLGH